MSARDQITPDERQQIDAAIAAGRGNPRADGGIVAGSRAGKDANQRMLPLSPEQPRTRQGGERFQGGARVTWLLADELANYTEACRLASEGHEGVRQWFAEYAKDKTIGQEPGGFSPPVRHGTARKHRGLAAKNLLGSPDSLHLMPEEKASNVDTEFVRTPVAGSP